MPCPHGNPHRHRGALHTRHEGGAPDSWRGLAAKPVNGTLGHRGIERRAVLRYCDQTRLDHMITQGGGPVTVVTISSRFQVVMPSDVRERLNLRHGQQVDAVPFRGRVELIPLEPVQSVRASPRGIDTRVPRDDDRAMNVGDTSAWLEYFADGPVGTRESDFERIVDAAYRPHGG